MSVVAPNAQHLSPAVGLALSAGGAQLIANLYELEPRVPMATGTRGFSADGVPVTFQGSPSGALCRDIFHRNHPEEPLRPTSNRSLPAAHLSASLVADTLGLAWRRPGKSEVRDVLKRATCSETGLQVPALARETGVSIARFERLIDQVILADDDPHAPLPYMGTSLLLRHLWLRSSSRRELWTYLSTLDVNHGPVLVESDLCDADWTALPPFTPQELAGECAHGAARDLLTACTKEDLYDDQQGSKRYGAAFEILAASLTCGGSRAPPVNQARYSFRGQPAVADCAELCARELLNAYLWDAATLSFDPNRLPSTACPALLAFYAVDGPANREVSTLQPGQKATANGVAAAPAGANWHAGAPIYTQAAKEWFEIVSGLPGVSYLTGISSARYELAPTCDAVAHCIGVLLGQPSVASPSDLSRFWRDLHPSRGFQLIANASGERMRLLEPSAETGDLECSLELVMSTRLNHAFAIHHWRPPAWQRDAAELALDAWPHARSVALALMPSLVQALLHSSQGSCAHLTSQARQLMLLCTNTNDDEAIALGLLRLLDTNDASDTELAARFLAATSKGLSNADDGLLLLVGSACARAPDIVRSAALLHPPLSAATAAMMMVTNRKPALSALTQALRASPIRSASVVAQATICGIMGQRK